MGSKVSGKSAIFSPLKIALPPPPPLSMFRPDFPETFDANDETGFEMLGEGEEGCETPYPPNVV